MESDSGSESESNEHSATSLIPRGGPNYLPNMVGNLSTIPEFQSSFLSLLQDLGTHLSLEPTYSCQQFDVSTDTLKIYTEEELTEMAMKEAFPEDNLSQSEFEPSLNTSHQFRLGASHLYCHQGNCKHMIVIRDMRLSHPEDVQSRVAYPIVFQSKHKFQKCSVCKIRRASKVAVDDKWTKENPCYFCDYCFELLHSEEGPLEM